MEIVYLGFFERVFNFILNKIFQPVFKFLASLLNTIFSWIFEKILAPILMPILQKVFIWALDLVMKLFGKLLYTLLAGLGNIIDVMEEAFDVFIGLKNVQYTGAGAGISQGTLLEVLMSQKSIATVFWAIAISGLGIALLLSIYATAKSSMDLDFENKRPVSRVMTSLFKCVVWLFSVPFLVAVVLQLSVVVLASADMAINYASSGTTANAPSLGRILFLVTSLDAVNVENDENGKAYNISTAEGRGAEDQIGTDQDPYRAKFYYKKTENGILYDYTNVDLVGETFDYTRFDYIIGFVVAVFLLVILAMCLVIFIQRIFELILLYLISPYFVAMMPIDDGEKFGQWREMFLAKAFTGFGAAIGMRLYLMLCPIIMTNQIQFDPSASVEVSYLMKLFFLIGGAWAIYKSSSMVTSLLNAQAGSSEQATGMLAGGFMFAQTAGRLGGYVSRGVNHAAGSLFGGSHGSKGADGGRGPGEAGGPGGKGGMGDSGSGAYRGSGKSGSGGAKPPLVPGRPVPKAAQAKSTPMTRSDPLKNYHTDAAKLKAKTPVDRNQQFVAKNGKRAGQNFSLGFGGLGIGVDAKGQRHMTFNLGRFGKNTYSANGEHKFRVLGCGFTRDQNGKITSIKTPVYSKKKVQMQDGTYHTSKVSIAGGLRTTRLNTDTGKMYFSDCSLTGHHIRRSGEDNHVDYEKSGIKTRVRREDGGYECQTGPLHFSLGSSGKMEGWGLGRMQYRSADTEKSGDKEGRK